MPADVRFDPFRGITTLRAEMNRLAGRAVDDGGPAPARPEPAVDIFETDSASCWRPSCRDSVPTTSTSRSTARARHLRGASAASSKVYEGRYYGLERAYGRLRAQP